MKYDIIICGGGHAGLEAAYVASKFGLNIGLISLNHDTIGQMSCNPSIGGISKGIVVRELDALGGLMPQIADRSAIQYKILNTKKGPAMQAIRQQTDKYIYARYTQDFIGAIKNINIIQDEIIDFDKVEDNKLIVYTKRGMQYICKSIIFTTGTFLGGKIYIGKYTTSGGRIGEFSADILTRSFEKKGIILKRFKTGTPARAKKNSINYEKLILQEGEKEPIFFSIKSKINNIDILPILPCYIAHTNEKTKKVIQDHKDEIPLYSGVIKGIGPRYCPSFEDKVFKFQDKTAHQIFVEPEGITSETVYLNGISTSLAEKYQLDLLRSIEGFENIEIVKPAYAVEYDIIDPTQLKNTLECTKFENIYFAGQINGTSGYEEAAGQGFIAGINSALKIIGKEPFILSRKESYIGVMIDDLVNKGVDEPYRLFTARAEARLEIRNNNAYERLIEYSKKYKLLENEIQEYIEKQLEEKEKLREKLLSTKIKGKNNIKLDLAIKQDAINFKDFVLNYCDGNIDREFAESLFIDIKYEGYIQHEKMLHERITSRKDFCIPDDFDYNSINNLSFETKQRLNKIKPKNFSELFNIPGLRPVDIVTLENTIRKNKK